MTTTALSPIPSTSAVQDGRRGRAFNDVREDIAARHDLMVPDVVLPLSRLRATPEGRIDVPGIGELSLNDWSRGQISRMLGIRWDRWFDESLVEPLERADELNRRFKRHDGEWRIRARRLGADDDQDSNGVLRAVVSPTYAPIDDSRVFDRLADALGGRWSEFRFMRVSLTAATSQYVAVAEAEIDLGVRSFDPHLSGFLVANSEVGARALDAIIYMVRLVCTNGLTARTEDRFHRVHRTVEDGALEKGLAEFLSRLPEGWTKAVDRLLAARRFAIAVPETAIEHALSQVRPLKRHTDAVIEAFRVEPEPNLFGVVQAMTRAAQRLSPEGRLELEGFAGRYLAAKAPGA